MKKALRRARVALEDVWENLVVYLSAVAGVLLTKFGPPLVEMFVSNKPFTATKLTILQVCFGFAVAVVVIFRSEQRGLTGTPADAQKLVGRSGNLKWRVEHAFSAGAGWYAIVAGFISASTGGGT